MLVKMPRNLLALNKVNLLLVLGFNGGQAF
jgi:hypothetical protein